VFGRPGQAGGRGGEGLHETHVAQPWHQAGEHVLLDGSDDGHAAAGLQRIGPRVKSLPLAFLVHHGQAPTPVFPGSGCLGNRGIRRIVQVAGAGGYQFELGKAVLQHVGGSFEGRLRVARRHARQG